MKHENPCFDCPDSGHGNGSGCGKHSTCKKYIDFYGRRREEYKSRKRAAITNSYVKDAIERVKGGTRCTLKSYRPKEGK